jgi:hypothetical protein
MTTPTNSHVSLRDYVDTRLDALDLAVNKAEQQLRERLAGMNEFRYAIRDQSRQFATKETMDVLTANIERQIATLSARVWELEKKQANAEGRSWMLFALLGLFLTALSIVLRFVI